MGTDNLNNRSTALTPRILAEITEQINEAVVSIHEQYIEAFRDHSEELLEAHELYFGKSL